MKRALVVLLAACSPAPPPALPSASLTPHIARAFVSRACGDDVALDGHATPDIRYSYSYDELGRLVGEIGTYATSAADETIVFSYDHLDHETRWLDSYPGGGTAELDAAYDTLGDLVDYTYSVDAAPQRDVQHYVMSEFTAAGQPTSEVVSETNEPDTTYVLAYDDSSRIISAIANGTAVTTYTYDDDGRTVSVDTDHGAFTGMIVYDDHDDELSETWGGSDPSAVASETSYEYDGARMTSATYERGTPLAVIETDTLRYCSQ